jgi:hypothetical protein
VDGRISGFAEQQHGVVSRAQLLEAGVNRYAIGRRLARGQLHVIHRGVYAAGHRSLTADGRLMAATLAAGPDAVASHRAAASILMIMTSRYLEVTAPTRRVQPESSAEITRSEFEARFRAFIAEFDLDRPELNQWLQIAGL